jgi:uncharacterized membrane-anchored protein YhcB (DUF1043 family)
MRKLEENIREKEMERMSELSTRDLFSQLQDRVIMKLQENEVVCPECKGLRFVLVEKSEEAYISSCGACHTGKLYVCKHCGKGNKTDYCNCSEANEERNNNFRQKQAHKEYEAFQKAEKVHYKDYSGHFILPDSEYLKDIEDVSDWIQERLSDGDDVPEYLWAVEGERHFSIDLKEVICEKCEDGYEEMYQHLDTKSNLLTEAQELINKWQEKQGERLYIFSETYKKAVIIKDLIKEITETSIAKARGESHE